MKKVRTKGIESLENGLHKRKTDQEQAVILKKWDVHLYRGGRMRLSNLFSELIRKFENLRESTILYQPTNHWKSHDRLSVKINIALAEKHLKLDRNNKKILSIYGVDVRTMSLPMVQHSCDGRRSLETNLILFLGTVHKHVYAENEKNMNSNTVERKENRWTDKKEKCNM